MPRVAPWEQALYGERGVCTLTRSCEALSDGVGKEMRTGLVGMYSRQTYMSVWMYVNKVDHPLWKAPRRETGARETERKRNAWRLCWLLVVRVVHLPAGGVSQLGFRTVE